jgi:hypothetical protein
MVSHPDHSWTGCLFAFEQEESGLSPFRLNGRPSAQERMIISGRTGAYLDFAAAVSPLIQLHELFEIARRQSHRDS